VYNLDIMFKNGVLSLLLLAPHAAAALVVAGTAGQRRGHRAAVAMVMVEPLPPVGFTWADTEPSLVEPVAPSMVTVLADSDAVAAEVCARLNAAAEKAIAARGYFALGIPGGSILKMLQGSAPSWASQTTLAYVNHKAVPMDDLSLATHAKASSLFLDQWEGVNTILMDGTADAAAEAESYEAKMRDIPEEKLPCDPVSGLPLFDMMLVGVGDDGHVGSLYPDRPEVSDGSGRWVLPVEMKTPGSITLTLPVMAAAKEVIIAACGVSDKYPKGKSAAMVRAIEAEETPTSFPAVGLRSCASWVIDAAAAGLLSSDYKPA